MRTTSRPTKWPKCSIATWPGGQKTSGLSLLTLEDFWQSDKRLVCLYTIIARTSTDFKPKLPHMWYASSSGKMSGLCPTFSHFFAKQLGSGGLEMTILTPCFLHAGKAAVCVCASGFTWFVWTQPDRDFSPSPPWLSRCRMISQHGKQYSWLWTNMSRLTDLLSWVPGEIVCEQRTHDCVLWPIFLSITVKCAQFL